MNQRLMLLLALVTFSLPLAACGGGESEVTKLSFDALDTFAFDPDTASANAESLVEVTLNNEGALQHTWTLVSADVDLATVRDDNALAGVTTGSVLAGESKTINFTAPAAGTYQFVCTVPGHAQAGMVGTLTVN